MFAVADAGSSQIRAKPIGPYNTDRDATSIDFNGEPLAGPTTVLHPTMHESIAQRIDVPAISRSPQKVEHSSQSGLPQLTMQSASESPVALASPWADRSVGRRAAGDKMVSGAGGR
ncbi:MAG: hypothetical protein FD144_2102 [Rhodospirillaceae bacterium]|nr:MAG: hypothetical protein FD144_2102 [Rhodospirillaceae bacterium]